MTGGEATVRLTAKWVERSEIELSRGWLAKGIREKGRLKVEGEEIHSGTSGEGMGHQEFGVKGRGVGICWLLREKHDPSFSSLGWAASSLLRFKVSLRHTGGVQEHIQDSAENF